MPIPKLQLVNEFITDNFFFIDSNNYKYIMTKFYGYALIDNSFYFNCNPTYNIIPNDTAGCYINIIRNDKSIIIQQDFYGSYGIYIFKCGNYFALSSSLLLLIEKIKNKYELTLNTNFIDYIIQEPLISLSYNSTYVNEIEQIDSDKTIIISLHDGHISYKSNSRNFASIEIDSHEAFIKLDEWHNKYNNFVNSILKNNFPLLIDLSGGKDSRMSLSTLFPHIDSKNFTIYTDRPFTKHAKDDFNISSCICNLLGLPLNNDLKIPYKSLDYSTSLLIAYHTKFLYVTRLITKNRLFINPVFRFTGNGGEAIREYWTGDALPWLDKYFFFPELKGALPRQKIIDFISNEMLAANKDISPSCPELHNFYIQTRLRYLSQRYVIQNFLMNEILISPLLDPILYKINHKYDDTSRDLLSTIILDRYLPQLNNIGFQGNRKIDDDILKIAKNLNKKYKFKSSHKDFNFILYCNTFLNDFINSDLKINNLDVRSLSKDKELVDFIKSNWSDELYQFYYNTYSSISFTNDRFFTPFIQIKQLIDLLSSKNNKLIHSKCEDGG